MLIHLNMIHVYIMKLQHGRLSLIREFFCVGVCDICLLDIVIADRERIGYLLERSSSPPRQMYARQILSL